jgi:tRNA(Glu) U13 pseudouridine synthase TruD
MLRLHSQAFGFAGTKDRRGVTTQYVTLFKVDPGKLAGLNPRFVFWVEGRAGELPSFLLLSLL